MYIQTIVKWVARIDGGIQKKVKEPQPNHESGRASKLLRPSLLSLFSPFLRSSREEKNLTTFSSFSALHSIALIAFSPSPLPQQTQCSVWYPSAKQKTKGASWYPSAKQKTRGASWYPSAKQKTRGSQAQSAGACNPVFWRTGQARS
jgi:hypothetical protein